MILLCFNKLCNYECAKIIIGLPV